MKRIAVIGLGKPDESSLTAVTMEAVGAQVNTAVVLHFILQSVL